MTTTTSDNAFAAIRISLASPDQIKAWSYGEVTKPETINYRNQKPEKDGLFDERIFGPTKDFECYCGKYKRIRYRGVICDRCGVEVTRAKVRRERMGHVTLAAPVAHIWFAKGTPAWLGLLLDISPRNLERVLYYAQYVITSVDEEAKQKVLARFEKQEEQEVTEVQAGTEKAVAAVRQRMDESLADIESRRARARAEVDAGLEERQRTLRDEAATLRARMDDLEGQETPEELRLHDRVVVEAGASVTEAHRDLLASALSELGETATTEVAGALAKTMARLDAEQERMTRAAAEEVDHLQRTAGEKVEEIRRTGDDRRGEVEELKPLRSLTESRCRELRERYADLFTPAMGAEALLGTLRSMDLDTLRDELSLEATGSTGQRAKKAAKRLRVVEAFRKSGNRPEWMVLTVLPILPPDLRPMVQLDGGRFATSDLNDLYRRVINRNNRLKRLMDLGAPEIIVRNEKRMLQEAVDALVDNGRRGRALTGSHNHKLKSLSDMLRGKQGRFRQNLLGKRVDYSGRSVIVVGPSVKFHQCGLPKRMALELFKPFVMHRLVLRGLAPNIKSAKRMVDRVRPEVWDLLEEVIRERPVLLNRAPTLHRLGIQAFEPILVEGSAIQIHPLVCAAYNADFDGDQMAVHVPIGRRAVEEARQVMLSTKNMLLPSSGEPVVAPTLDIVVGCYYLTMVQPGAQGEGKRFITFADAKLAYDLGQVDLRTPVRIREGIAVGPDRQVVLLPRLRAGDGGRTETTPPPVPEPLPEGWRLEPMETTVGRILFNEVLPSDVPYRNRLVDKKGLKEVVSDCYRLLDNQGTARVLDAIKGLGFRYATESGLTIALNDVVVPVEKAGLLAEADGRVAQIQRNYQRGFLTETEQEERTIEVWQEINRRMEELINKQLPSYGNLYLMAGSGAKGNIAQIKQMAGMRGLMADPRGKILPLPIRSSFREGLTVLEYFISTHGARKGLADTALRTADSGYLTRRLIDVAQDVITLETDCATTEGIWIETPTDRPLLGTLAERIKSRLAAAPVADPRTGEILVDRNQEIDDTKAAAIQAAGIHRVYVRSPLTCAAPRGLCRYCYGWSLARGRLANLGEALGVIAAQSIGEPGTQLTMRTFHTGGVAGADITSGLPRVEELFEARSPKTAAPLAEIDGVVEIMESAEGRQVRLINDETVREDYILPEGYEVLVRPGAYVEAGAELARSLGAVEPTEEAAPLAPLALRAALDGEVSMEGRTLSVVHRGRDERAYAVAPNVRVLVEPGQRVTAGTALAEGPLNPQDVLRIRGREALQRYLVDEVQKVYRSQGVVIHDKHIEIIARQMLRRVRIDSPGDTEFPQGELVDRFLWQSVNAKVLAEGGEPSTAQTILLGITKVSLSTDSFLAAASFQETTRILTEAALFGKVDRLLGLKENVIIGRLIPARFDIGQLPQPAQAAAAALAEPPQEASEGKESLGLEAILDAAAVGSLGWTEEASEDDLEADNNDETGLPAEE